MTEQQRAFVLLKLHYDTSSSLSELLNKEMQNFGLSENEKQAEQNSIETLFYAGIKNLNENQFKNFLKTIDDNKYNKKEVLKKLFFYEIDEEYHENILKFFEYYRSSNKSIDVGDLDESFRGVQVATRDNFNTIINQGYTGDWVIKPENIKPFRIQIASMNDNGHFPRGWYINADITDIQPVTYDEQVRHRIFITNAVLVNTGNRNVKFNMNPVKYI